MRQTDVCGLRVFERGGCGSGWLCCVLGGWAAVRAHGGRSSSRVTSNTIVALNRGVTLLAAISLALNVTVAALAPSAQA